MSQKPLTPQEINIASRYGLENFTENAIYSMPHLSNDSGSFTSFHLQNQDRLNNKKQQKIAGDERNTFMDWRRQNQRIKEHSRFYYHSPFNYPR